MGSMSHMRQESPGFSREEEVKVPEELLPVYERFFRRFGFCLSGSRVGLYRIEKREFFFNRTLV